MDITPFGEAIKDAGSQAALAERIGVSQGAVGQWASGTRPIPQERCADIERVTKGLVTCEALRRDIVWYRVPDKTWPWHKKGRPTVDLTRAERATEKA